MRSITEIPLVEAPSEPLLVPHMARLRKIGKAGNYFAYFYDRNRSPQEKSYALRTTRKDVARRRFTKIERQYECGEFDPWHPPEERNEAVSVSEAIERFLKAKPPPSSTL